MTEPSAATNGVRGDDGVETASRGSARHGSETKKKKPFENVLIVGAGPAGLLLAILLARSGIPSTVLEAWDRPDERLRATQYGVPATRVFRRAGLLDDMRARGIDSFPYICWRSARTGERIAGIDLSVVADEPDRMTVLPLSQMLDIMVRHCRERYAEHVTLLFNHKVERVGQDDAGAWAEVRLLGGGGEEEEGGRTTTTAAADRVVRFGADYLVGCDGSKSTVRQCLFQRHWPGETFAGQLLVQNVYYKGFEEHGWDGGNYMIDDEFWGLIAKRGKANNSSNSTTNGPLWRVTYGDLRSAADEISEEEHIRRRAAAFKKLLPGHPDPSQYTVTQTSRFRIHNRCVDAMRVGRVLLAGDAAHVCNPFGGYGCMAAVLDVDGLADCLVGVYEGKAAADGGTAEGAEGAEGKEGKEEGKEGILDAYARIRRQKFVDFVDRRSRKNMDRIARTDPDTALETDPFLRLLKSMEGNAERTKEFLLKVSSIEFDFTTLYSKTGAEEE
ncbi:hypothetical protein JDV02_009112 [Purpureocillium takamizusanense]|uniref:FAD-binding domain-containing protein n=1 Tax=Purpureocillium takamizusanense TaxID=2060973 RepID=A0A9Q8VF47_9HYPO|nr:uncharacterized protein JDV02_009112 [Purpureocillium takamizusanense]UNI23283.1 hypothetical protein JDV02_009112 [Purpureocillium takamizusanense]